MKRKALALGLTFAMILGLSGCADTDQQQVSGDAEQKIEEQDDGIAKLTVWGSADDQAQLKEMIAGFEKEYEGQAQFDITVAKMEEADASGAVLEDMTAAADVFVFRDEYLKELVAAGALDPVQNPDAVERVSTTYSFEAASFNSTLYAYPMATTGAYVTYFNKEFLTAAETAGADSIIYKVEQQKKLFAMDWSDPKMVYAFFGDADLTLKAREDGRGNETNLNAITGVNHGAEVSQGIVDIAYSDNFASMPLEEILTAAEAGEVVVFIADQDIAEDVKAIWGDNCGISRIPIYTLPGGQLDMSSPIEYRMVGVNAYSEDVDWAHKLASYLTNEENQQLRLKKNGDRPTNSAVASSTEAKADPIITAVNAQEKYSYRIEMAPGYEEALTGFALWIFENKFMESDQVTDADGKEIFAAKALTVDLQDNLDVLKEAIESGGAFAPIPVEYPEVEIPEEYETLEEYLAAIAASKVTTQVETTEEGVDADVQEE